MANVRQRGEDRWELRVYVGRDPITGGKRYETKTVDAASERDAERAAWDFERAVRRARPGARQVTVGDLLERWYKLHERDWSPATARATRDVLDTTFLPLAEVRLGDLRTADLDDFYAALRARGGRDGKGLSVATVTRRHGMLRKALDQAVRWEIIETNPAVGARPGRLRKKRVTPPTTDEVLALLEAAGGDDGSSELLCYLALDAETGARRGEIAALRLDDFDLAPGAGTVSISRDVIIGLATPENARDYAGHYWPADVPRGRRPTALIEKDPKTEESVRVVAIGDATVELVRDQARRITERAALAGLAYPADGFLFPADGAGRRPLRPDTWTHRYARLRADLGLDHVRLHDLRHYVATALLTAGHDLATVAGRLGHGGGGKTTLAIYAHFLKQPDRAASDHMARLLAGPVRPANVVDLPATGTTGRPVSHPSVPSTTSGQKAGRTKGRTNR